MTNTCAANLLGIVAAGDYACGSAESARLGFAAAGRYLGLDADEVARRMLEASGRAVGRLAAQVAHEHEIAEPVIMAVGGGAGGLGRDVAARLGLECIVPTDAEVISSIGDALSLVRAERERTIADPTAEDVDRLIAEVELEAVSAGAGPASLEVRVEYLGDRKALRAVATGSIGLEAGAAPGRLPATLDMVTTRAAEHGGAAPEELGVFWLARGDDRVVVLDRFGDVVVAVTGDVIRPHGRGGPGLRDKLAKAVDARTRTVGPMRVVPSVWVVRPMRVTELASGDVVEAGLALADTDETTAIIVGRE